jgi:hypothetical protein
VLFPDNETKLYFLLPPRQLPWTFVTVNAFGVVEEGDIMGYLETNEKLVYLKLLFSIEEKQKKKKYLL